jgi:hypothetical protein
MLVHTKINEDLTEESFFESSNVLHMKYNQHLSKMTILFESKRMYIYHDIPKYMYYRIVNADSQGAKIHELLGKSKGKRLYKEEYIKDITTEQLEEIKQFINEAKK